MNSYVARLSESCRARRTLNEFGQRLISGLVPVLGGGVAALDAFEPDPGRLQRVAGFGLAGARRGRHLPAGRRAGRPVRPRGPAGRPDRPAAGLLPDRLRPGTGRAGAGRRVAAEFRDARLASSNMPRSGRSGRTKQALLDELLPVAGMSLEILRRSLRTQELLRQTQAQTEQLTAQRRQLQASEERRTRLILDSSSEGIFVRGPGGPHQLREPGRLAGCWDSPPQS